METIKSYTDIEQSKKLAEILPLDSADMTYYACIKDWRGNPVEPKWGKPANLTKEELALPCSNFQKYEYVPCWSLAVLLSILDFPALTQEKEDGWEVCVCDYDNDGYIEKIESNPVDACYEMILKLHELNLL